MSSNGRFSYSLWRSISLADYQMCIRDRCYTFRKEYCWAFYIACVKVFIENCSIYGKTVNYTTIMHQLTRHCLSRNFRAKIRLIIPQPPYSPDMPPVTFSSSENEKKNKKRQRFVIVEEINHKLLMELKAIPESPPMFWSLENPLS